jgi:hypothetical protein
MLLPPAPPEVALEPALALPPPPLFEVPAVLAPLTPAFAALPPVAPPLECARSPSSLPLLHESDTPKHKSTQRGPRGKALMRKTIAEKSSFANAPRSPFLENRDAATVQTGLGREPK